MKRCHTPSEYVTAFLFRPLQFVPFSFTINIITIDTKNTNQAIILAIEMRFDYGLQSVNHRGRGKTARGAQ